MPRVAGAGQYQADDEDGSECACSHFAYALNSYMSSGPLFSNGRLLRSAQEASRQDTATALTAAKQKFKHAAKSGYLYVRLQPWFGDMETRAGVATATELPASARFRTGTAASFASGNTSAFRPTNPSVVVSCIG